MPTYTTTRVHITAAQIRLLQQAFYQSIMSPRSRQRTQYKKYKDPLLDLDTKVREALTKHRDRCFSVDWWPRQGSEDEKLLIAYGLGEFIQGVLEEEDRFKKSWEER